MFGLVHARIEKRTERLSKVLARQLRFLSRLLNLLTESPDTDANDNDLTPSDIDPLWEES